ncbi:MAG: hypothetical protein V1689_01000, partial [Pseudomonadota bacterium]
MHRWGVLWKRHVQTCPGASYWVQSQQRDIWFTERSVVGVSDNQVWARGGALVYPRRSGKAVPIQGLQPEVQRSELQWGQHHPKTDVPAPETGIGPATKGTTQVPLKVAERPATQHTGRVIPGRQILPTIVRVMRYFSSFMSGRLPLRRSPTGYYRIVPLTKGAFFYKPR